MNDNLTDKFIYDLFELTQASIPERVTFQSKKCLIDYIGVTLAGAKMIAGKGGRFLDCFGHQEKLHILELFQASSR